ncbi:MAG: flagellar motor protein [Sphaerobacter sp.]|nr:flagellar motor protein [Sphaerobacter sp.]
MDLATIAGLVLGLVALVTAFVLEGGHLTSLLGVTAAMIVFGGTVGATVASGSLADAKRIPGLILRSLKAPPDRRRALVDELVALAEVARREGLLALEDREVSDSFLRRAVMLVVDGTDPETTREILERDIAAMEARHQRGYTMFLTMGGFAPTMGIIGTVLGLIHVLSNLSSPDELGPAIAVAFLATLYGVASANLIWIPIGNKLRRQSEHEVEERAIVVEGVLGLQAGDNPRVLREKLAAALPPALRAAPASPTAASMAGAMAEGGE